MSRSKSLLAVAIGFIAASLSSAQAVTEPASPDATPSRWQRLLGPLAPHVKAAPQPSMPLLATDAEPWTIDRALARALAANADVQVAFATMQKAAGLRTQAVGQILPHVALIGTADRRDPDLIDRSAAELRNAALPVNPQPLSPISDRSYNALLEVRQVLFDGLASWTQVKRMALLEKKAAIDARDMYLRVASQLRQGFDVALARQAVVGVRRDAVRDLTRLAEVAQKRFEFGQISELETLRARSVLSSAEADLAQAEAELVQAEELLCRMLYIARPPQGLQLVGKLTPLDYKETFESALSRAQAGRLDVRSAELQLDSAKAAQQIAKGAFAPRIEAFVNYGYHSSYYDSSQELNGWTIGVVGRWDIFDGGQSFGALKAQRAERRAAEVRLAEAQQLVGSQVRQLYSSLEQSKFVMASHDTARALGERSVSEARKQYEVGKASLEQVLDAELIYRQAFVGWVGAVYTYNATVYQLDYATNDEKFLDQMAPAAR